MKDKVSIAICCKQNMQWNKDRYGIQLRILQETLTMDDVESTQMELPLAWTLYALCSIFSSQFYTNIALKRSRQNDSNSS